MARKEKPTLVVRGRSLHVRKSVITHANFPSRVMEARRLAERTCCYVAVCVAPSKQDNKPGAYR